MICAVSLICWWQLKPQLNVCYSLQLWINLKIIRLFKTRKVQFRCKAMIGFCNEFLKKYNLDAKAVLRCWKFLILKICRDDLWKPNINCNPWKGCQISKTIKLSYDILRRLFYFIICFVHDVLSARLAVQLQKPLADSPRNIYIHYLVCCHSLHKCPIEKCQISDVASSNACLIYLKWSPQCLNTSSAFKS